jgi:hypothetical protein
MGRIEERTMNTKGQVKHWLHEGNIRRVVVTREEQTIAQVPLTVAVVGAVLAPALAVAAALAALLTKSSVRVETVETPDSVQPIV